MQPPDIVSFHHVRLPVSDVLSSHDWYIDIFGFRSVLTFETEDRVTGVALEHPCGAVLGLHQDAERAGALRGFVVIGLCVPDISEWAGYLDRRAVPHTAPEFGHLGRHLQIADPDGILVELHTLEQPSADET